MPVDPTQVHEFDPEGVPTVGQLLRELDNATVDAQQHHSGMMPCSSRWLRIYARALQIGKRLP